MKLRRWTAVRLTVAAVVFTLFVGYGMAGPRLRCWLAVPLKVFMVLLVAGLVIGLIGTFLVLFCPGYFKSRPKRKPDNDT